MMTTAIAVWPIAASADELGDLKAQLSIATKEIQTLERRVHSLEEKKAKEAEATRATIANPPAKAEPVAAAAPATTATPPVKTEPKEEAPVAAPVVAPNEHLTVEVPGLKNGRLEIYGAAMLDAIYDANRVDPNWVATLRPSKIAVNCPPVGEDPGCGKSGVTTFSVRQSTLGFKGFLPTSLGELKTQFEFDLFGMGSDAGKTSFRLKQAWGSLGPFLAGYTYTLFMDADVFPNTIDFWGPSGLIYLYDPQIRYTPYEHDGIKFSVALEVPGFAVDIGKVADQIPELGNIREKTQYPDITAQLRADGSWGHAQVAGVARWISFHNPAAINGEPSNTLFGWGVNVAGSLNTFGKDTLNGQLAYGEGIASFSNDCCFDLGPNANLRAQTLPLLNWLIYYNRWWNDQWSSAIGYSENVQNNSAGQFDTEQHKGSYASVNLLYYPIQNLMVGVEGLWGERVNKDGAAAGDRRVQVSTKFSF
jgi:hypothetical protein